MPQGGRREGAGRKRLTPDGMERRSVTLTPAMWEYIQELGGDNISAGLRALIEAYQQARERKPHP